MTLTQRTIKWLEVQGFTAGKVEHYSTFSKKTHDLFGFIDIVAIKPGFTPVGVQSTAWSCVSARRKKIKAEPRYLVWLDAQCRIMLIGWRKVKGRYQCKVEWIDEGCPCRNEDTAACPCPRNRHAPKRYVRVTASDAPKNGKAATTLPDPSERDGSQPEAIPCQPDGQQPRSVVVSEADAPKMGMSFVGPAFLTSRTASGGPSCSTV